MGKVVLTTGVFDCGMHIGHFMLLWKCHQLAGPDGRVIVGVNTDKSVEEYKRRPVFGQNSRFYNLTLIPFVDTVFYIHSEKDICDTITSENIDYYVKGEEWANKPVTGSDLTQVIFMQDIKGLDSGEKISTTEIIKKIKERDVHEMLKSSFPTKDSVLKSAEKDNLI